MFLFYKLQKNMETYILQQGIMFKTFFECFYNWVSFFCKYDLRFRGRVCLCPLSFCFVYVFMRYVYI
jgi:hypothetical protein